MESLFAVLVSSVFQTIQPYLASYLLNLQLNKLSYNLLRTRKKVNTQSTSRSVLKSSQISKKLPKLSSKLIPAKFQASLDLLIPFLRVMELQQISSQASASCLSSRLVHATTMNQFKLITCLPLLHIMRIRETFQFILIPFQMQVSSQ